MAKTGACAKAFVTLVLRGNTVFRHEIPEFSTIEQARRWYDSEEYGALVKALRLRTARGSVVLVEGV